MTYKMGEVGSFVIAAAIVRTEEHFSVVLPQMQVAGFAEPEPIEVPLEDA